MAGEPRWRRYLRFFGPDSAADIEEELRFHVESKVEELEKEGWTAEAARREAARQFGDLNLVREICEAVAKRSERRMRIQESWSAFAQDVRYGVRQLRQGLGTNVLALMALGAGMGVVTAVFSIVYAVVLKPLPFPDADQLVWLWSVRRGIDDVVTPRNFAAWEKDAQSFQAIGALQPTTFTFAGAGQASEITGGFVSAGYFRAFGVSPELGRTFTAEEERPPRLHLVILSDRFWRERCGGDRQIVGRQIRLNREAYTVVGVMPAAFSIRPSGEQAWAPLALSGQEMHWTGGVLRVVGRLRTGVKREQAQAQMNLLARHLETLYPEMNRKRGIRVRDYAAELVGDYESRLFILLGAVGLVLLIACANVANLLLARTAGRKPELAVRAALGATRARVVRQLLTESLLIGLLGAGLGLLAAQGLIEIVGKLNLQAIPRLEQASVNAPVFLFAFGLALLSTTAAGLLPALRAAEVDIQTALRQGGRGSAGMARDTARNIYIATEVAVALVLLASAGLLIRTGMAAQSMQPGFSPAHVISGRTALAPAVYRNARETTRAYNAILQELRTQPGVIAAALTSKVPLSAGTVGLALKTNAVSPPLREEFATELRYISDGYLSTMRIRLRSGREFDPYDRAGSEQDVLVSDTLARHLWPAGRALGKTIRIPELEGKSEAWQVVGVVADVRVNGLLSEPPAVVYVSFRQLSTNAWHWIEQSLYLVARTRSAAVDGGGVLRRALREVDPELPLGDVSTMEQRLASSTALARFYTLLLSLLGCGGLLLTLAGIYGVVAYFASRQRAEIGVRLALGSSAGRVLLLIIGQGMRPVACGVGIGLLATVAATRLLANELYGVSATDPLTLLAVTALLLGVAACACFLPARKAARADPTAALRNG